MALAVDSFSKTVFRVVKVKEQEMKNAYMQSAFIGWQIQEIVKGAMVENPKPQRFFDYAAQLGLIEKPKPEKTSKEAISEAIRIAEAIKAADQKGTS
jgi:hypothetical protein